MACKSPKLVWVANRLHVQAVGDPLPGVHGVEGVSPERAGFKNSGMRSGYYLPVDCRTCSSCVVRAINSRVGSMLAESQYSPNSAFLTLTYANDPGSNTRADLAHKLLMKRHLREFTEAMRKDRTLGKVRWFISGEYGPLHGRSHWHAIMFGAGGAFPAFDYSSSMSHSRLWPHGAINAQPLPDHKAMAYVSKYAVKSLSGLKDDGSFLPGHEAVVSFSKYPPLGARFYQEHGGRLGDHAVPLSFSYMPPGGVRAANYSIKGAASRRIVVNSYLDQLEAAGHDISFYGKPPRGHVPTGPAIPISPNPWIAKVLGEVIRERHLASLPVLSPQEDLAELVAKYDEQQAQQERINKRLAEKRHAASVVRARERSERFLRDFAGDPADCYVDDWDPFQYAAQVAKGDWWKDD